jgi:hypothetical protein
VSTSPQLPVLGFDFPLDGPNGWHEANRYLLYTGHFPLEAPPVALQEWLGSGSETVPIRNRQLSMVPAGTPHRLTHLAGFWRTSDADLIVLRALLPEALYLSLYVSSGPTHHYDRICWYCNECGTQLAPWEYNVERYGALPFWNKVLDPIRAFNADPAARTCPQCAAVHPIAYGFAAEADNEEERLARTIW